MHTFKLVTKSSFIDGIMKFMNYSFFQSSTAGTPGGKSFRFDSDSDNTDDEGIGTGGIFHKTQTAHDAPPTTPRRQPQASAKKPTGAAASSSSKFASTPSKPTQRSTKPNVSGVKGTSTFGLVFFIFQEFLGIVS